MGVEQGGAEQVLVIRREVFESVGEFQGFTTEVDRYVPRLLAAEHLLYMPRDKAEEDPAYKQIIPYVVFRCGQDVFHYRRGKGTGEERLRSLRSIGVGGHICQDDEGGDTYRKGLLREVHEEVVLDQPFTERCIGLINDDRTVVGRVHLGIVHLIDLARPQLARREDGLTECGFSPWRELARRRDEFETWSQFLLAANVLDDSPAT